MRVDYRLVQSGSGASRWHHVEHKTGAIRTQSRPVATRFREQCGIPVFAKTRWVRGPVQAEHIGSVLDFIGRRARR